MYVINSCRNSQGLTHKDDSDTRESVLALKLCPFDMETRYCNLIKQLNEVTVTLFLIVARSHLAILTF